MSVPPSEESRRDVLRILAEGTASTTGDEFFRSLARHAAEALRAKYAFVAETLSPDESASLAYWEGGAFGQGFSYRFPGTPCKRVAAGNICFTPTGLREAYPEDRWLVDIGADSYVGVPMKNAEGRTIGHVAVLHTEAMRPTDEHLAILRIFAARGCAELERVQAQRRERAVLEINNAIIRYRRQDQLLEAVGAALNQVVPFDRIALTLYAPGNNALRLEALQGAVHHSEFKPGQMLDLKTSHVGWVFEQRKTLLRRNLGEERQFGSETRLFDEGVNSMCTAPMLLAGDCIGTITIGSHTAERFREADAALLEAAANQVALAVSNVRAFEEIAALKSRLQAENLYLQEEIRAEHNFEEIVGQHGALLGLLREVEKVAATDSTVLLTGETGTGKELIARAIHGRSRRSERPLVKVNCGAISAGLVESELFGHVRGAFTGALTRRVGRFELADRGTLFLDEVGELPADAQVKLLRVLQEQEFEPVGSNETKRVDVRVIAATNRMLEDAVREGRFRADLYYRLNVIPLRVPPLRERRDDVPQLAAYFLDRAARKAGKSMSGIAPDTVQRLLAYHWPGNVRELQNLIERGVVLASDQVLRLDASLLAAPPPTPPALAPGARPTLAANPATPQELGSIEDVERGHILAALERARGVIEGPSGAAVILKLNASTLRSRMKKLGIARPIAHS